MKSEWCSYPERPLWMYKRGDHYGDYVQRIPRKRMVCPVCKRRLIARIVINSDGDLDGYRIPRHKASTIKPRRASRKAGRARIGRGRG